jgi:hypothetical protein
LQLHIPEGQLRIPEGQLRIPEGQLHIPEEQLRIPEEQLQSLERHHILQNLALQSNLLKTLQDRRKQMFLTPLKDLLENLRTRRKSWREGIPWAQMELQAENRSRVCEPLPSQKQR